MGKSYLSLSPQAQSLIQKADQILGFPISTIMFEGPDDRLKETDITQPALFISSAMALAVLNERGIQPHMVAGHSLGEYSALYAAHVLGFEETLKLVRTRGQAMQECAIKHPGTMAAIIGLDPAIISDICAEVNKDKRPCVPANFNQTAQTVISGEKEAVRKAMEICAQKGAAKTVELNVAGAFHSPLMSEAAEKMKSLIEKIPFNTPSCPVITNVDAKPTEDPVEIKRKLILQIDHPVLWDNSLKTMIQAGAETFVEVGSGKILSSMLRRLDKTKKAMWTDDFFTIEKNISTLSVQS